DRRPHRRVARRSRADQRRQRGHHLTDGDRRLRIRHQQWTQPRQRRGARVGHHRRAADLRQPNGTTVVTGSLTATDSPLTFTDAVLLNAGLTLNAGSSSVLFEGSATIAPGELTVAGSMTLSASATFAVTLNGGDPNSYSQLHATGPLDLGGSSLGLTL